MRTSKNPHDVLFQFLIGTLETRKIGTRIEQLQKRFQFLIGTLETELRNSGVRKVGGVSIPHRYARNAWRPYLSLIV